MTTKHHLRNYGLALCWLLLFGLMSFAAWRDPFDVTAPGFPYGQNHPGELLRTVALSIAEVGLLYAVLRPWSYRRAWLRALGALIVLLPWTVIYMAIMMHAGSIAAAHFLWLVAMDALLLVLLIISAASRARGSWRDTDI